MVKGSARQHKKNTRNGRGFSKPAENQVTREAYDEARNIDTEQILEEYTPAEIDEIVETVTDINKKTADHDKALDEANMKIARIESQLESQELEIAEMKEIISRLTPDKITELLDDYTAGKTNLGDAAVNVLNSALDRDDVNNFINTLGVVNSKPESTPNPTAKSSDVVNNPDVDNNVAESKDTKLMWKDGDKVSFRRTDGRIQNGIAALIGNGISAPEGRVVVTFSENGNDLQKTIRVSELMPPISENNKGGPEINLSTQNQGLSKEDQEEEQPAEEIYNEVNEAIEAASKEAQPPTIDEYLKGMDHYEKWAAKEILEGKSKRKIAREFKEKHPDGNWRDITHEDDPVMQTVLAYHAMKKGKDKESAILKAAQEALGASDKAGSKAITKKQWLAQNPDVMLIAKIGIGFAVGAVALATVAPGALLTAGVVGVGIKTGGKFATTLGWLKAKNVLKDEVGYEKNIIAKGVSSVIEKNKDTKFGKRFSKLISPLTNRIKSQQEKTNQKKQAEIDANPDEEDVIEKKYERNGMIKTAIAMTALGIVSVVVSEFTEVAAHAFEGSDAFDDIILANNTLDEDAIRQSIPDRYAFDSDGGDDTVGYGEDLIEFGDYDTPLTSADGEPILNADGEPIYIRPSENELFNGLSSRPGEVEGPMAGYDADGNIWHLESGRQLFENYDPINSPNAANMETRFNNSSRLTDSNNLSDIYDDFTLRLMSEPIVLADQISSMNPDQMSGMNIDQFLTQMQNDPAFFQEQFSEFATFWDSRGFHLDPNGWTEFSGTYATSFAVDTTGDGTRDLITTEVTRSTPTRVIRILDAKGGEVGMVRGDCVQFMTPGEIPPTWVDRPYIPEEDLPQGPPEVPKTETEKTETETEKDWDEVPDGSNVGSDQVGEVTDRPVHNESDHLVPEANNVAPEQEVADANEITTPGNEITVNGNDYVWDSNTNTWVRQ